MRLFLRRLAPVVLASLVLAGLVPVTHAAGLTLSQGENYQVQLLNKQRAALGLVPVRVDSRLTAIARARSNDMAQKDYFGHQQPDGRWAWDLISAAGITWYGAGEILAWNHGSADLGPSAENAAQQWRNSPTHYAVIKDANFNYVGVGVALDGVKAIWTAVFMKGPDRTGAWGRMGAASLGRTSTTVTSTGSVVGLRSVSFNWTGADVRLSVLTAGLYTFQLQKRLNRATDWMPFINATTRTTATATLTRGKLYEFRVRARDNKGNSGAWSAPIEIRP
jgi:uncharacterized protein YkwD